MRDELIAALRTYGNMEDLSQKSDEQLKNMIAGYQKKHAKILYSEICPYFLGVQKYDEYHWEIGCSRRKGCDITPYDRKNWAYTQARECLAPKDKTL